ncbi:hypothetical protein ACFL04_01560 [Patescibacteria group bacterium]
MKNKKGFIHIAVAITIGVIALSMAGVMIWYKGEADERAATTPAVVTTNVNNTNTSSLVDSSWELYTNSDLNTTFQHPSSAEVKEAYSGVVENPDADPSDQWESVFLTIGDYNLAMSQQDNHYGRLENTWHNTQYTKPLDLNLSVDELYNILNSDFDDIFKVEKLSTNTHTAVEFYELGQFNGQSALIYRAIIPHRAYGNVVATYILGDEFGTWETDNESQRLDLVTKASDAVGQIINENYDEDVLAKLDDFKTLIKTIRDITLDNHVSKDWPTHTNETFGFSFKYPAEFTQAENATAKTVSFTNDTGSININIFDRPVKASSVIGVYGPVSEPTVVKVGNQPGWQYIEGDAGCGWVSTHTPRGMFTLQIAFSSCEEQTLRANSDLQAEILTTFEFSTVVQDHYSYLQEFKSGGQIGNDRAVWNSQDGKLELHDYPIEILSSDLLLYPQDGHTEISNIDCNGRYCLIAVGRWDRVHRVVKYDLVSTQFTDITDKLPDFITNGDKVDFEWNGTDYIISNRQRLLKYSGNSVTILHDFSPRACDYPYYLSRGNDVTGNFVLFITSGCDNTNVPALFGKIDRFGQVTTVSSSLLTDSTLISEIGHNGERWLFAGKGTMLEYNGKTLTDVSDHFIAYKDLEPAGIVVNNLLWWIAWQTDDPILQLAEYNRVKATPLTNVLKGFDGVTVGDITGEEGNIAVSGKQGQQLNIIDREDNVIDVSYAIPHDIYGMHYSSPNFLLGSQTLIMQADRAGVPLEQFAEQFTLNPQLTNNVLSATVKIDHNVPEGASIKYYLSNNRGADWFEVSHDEKHEFTTTGNELSWRIVMSTDNIDNKPHVSSLEILYWVEQ